MLVKIYDKIIAIGYLQFNFTTIISAPNILEKENTLILLTAYINKFVNRIKQVAESKKIYLNEIRVLTSERLSNIDKFQLDLLPNFVNYFYISNSNTGMNENIGIIEDLEFGRNKWANDFLDYILKQNKNPREQTFYWNCNICGGNYNTGCLYFDPSECPKFL